MYKYIDEKRIISISPRRLKNDGYIYANEQDKPKYKDLVIEDKPTYDPETQELYSWFEDGEVITQKFKVVPKIVENS